MFTTRTTHARHQQPEVQIALLPPECDTMATKPPSGVARQPYRAVDDLYVPHVLKRTRAVWHCYFHTGESAMSSDQPS